MFEVILITYGHDLIIGAEFHLIQICKPYHPMNIESSPNNDYPDW